MRTGHNKIGNKEIGYSINIFSRFVKVFLFFLICQIYQCPIQYILHINCPGCGTTRAILAALKFDFILAFKCHPLFFIPVICAVYSIFREWIFIGIRNEKIVLLFFGLLYLLFWLVRIFE
ncbi:MAG: DUF2752 domain-containing protein [Lachnospiraceae bacterium]|nr:DUF2752 domain-containing protein [Lachnospiraceae bacterium]